MGVKTPNCTSDTYYDDHARRPFIHTSRAYTCMEQEACCGSVSFRSICITLDILPFSVPYIHSSAINLQSNISFFPPLVPVQPFPAHIIHPNSSFSHSFEIPAIVP